MTECRVEKPMTLFLRRFIAERGGLIGAAGIAVLLLLALFAPFIANGRPLLLLGAGGWQMPFLATFFAPDSPEYLIEQTFNYLLLALPVLLLALRFGGRYGKWLGLVLALALLTPFFMARPKLDKTDYRMETATQKAIFAPIPYGPFEPAGTPYEHPNRRHWLGTDPIGRDVAARLVYGARVSLAVGLGATALAMVIGVAVGMAAGYFRGVFDLAVMRLVEIVMCFPTFLLLLILMAMLNDHKFQQSILVVIAVLGLTGWIGVTYLVRGETLKQRALPYIQSCIVAGMPAARTMARHLLPNIAGPLLISFTFGVAGSILAESGLSFLGFGVQPPTASWGGLLRQAFDDPLTEWHLTVFPGILLFIAICSFNLTGEGLRKAFAPV